MLLKILRQNLQIEKVSPYGAPTIQKKTNSKSVTRKKNIWSTNKAQKECGIKCTHLKKILIYIINLGTKIFPKPEVSHKPFQNKLYEKTTVKLTRHFYFFTMDNPIIRKTVCSACVHMERCAYRRVQYQLFILFFPLQHSCFL